MARYDNVGVLCFSSAAAPLFKNPPLDFMTDDDVELPSGSSNTETSDSVPRLNLGDLNKNDDQLDDNFE